MQIDMINKVYESRSGDVEGRVTSNGSSYSVLVRCDSPWHTLHVCSDADTACELLAAHLEEF